MSEEVGDVGAAAEAAEAQEPGRIGKGLDGSPFDFGPGDGENKSWDDGDGEAEHEASAESEEPEETEESKEEKTQIEHLRQRLARAEMKVRRDRQDHRAEVAALHQKLELLTPVLNDYLAFKNGGGEELPSFEDDPEGAIAARVRAEAQRLVAEQQQQQQQAMQEAEAQLHGYVVNEYRQAVAADPRFGQAVEIAAYGFREHLEEAGIDAEEFPQHLVNWMKDQARQGIHPMQAVVQYAQQVQEWHAQTNGQAPQPADDTPTPAPRQKPGSAMFAKPSASRPVGKPLTVEDLTSMSHEDVAKLMAKGVITQEQLAESWTSRG